MKTLVVVAPTFKEEGNIRSFIEQVLLQQKFLSDISLHLLISDSHSPDRTPEIVKSVARENSKLHYLDVKERGLGLGLIQGLDYAVDKLKADYLITMEADLSNDPNQIPEFVEKLKKYDLVIGSRHVKGGKIVNWSIWRRALSSGANKTLKLISGTKKTSEFTNLYRGFTKDFWLRIRSNLQNNLDWIFVPAFIFEAIDTHAKTYELPIVYFDRHAGKSKMKTPSYTKNLLKYAVRYRLGKYGAFS